MEPNNEKKPPRVREHADNQGSSFGGWLDQLSVLLGTLTVVVIILLMIIIALLIVAEGM